jgi:hypothetical protein
MHEIRVWLVILGSAAILTACSASGPIRPVPSPVAYPAVGCYSIAWTADSTPLGRLPPFPDTVELDPRPLDDVRASEGERPRFRLGPPLDRTERAVARYLAVFWWEHSSDSVAIVKTDDHNSLVVRAALDATGFRGHAEAAGDVGPPFVWGRWGVAGTRLSCKAAA